MANKKIVFITANLTQIGGTERVVSYLANGLSKNDKYDIEVLNLETKNGEEKYKINSNVKISYVGINNPPANNITRLVANFINTYTRLNRYIKSRESNENLVVIGIGTGISYMLPYLYNKSHILIGTQHNPVRHLNLLDLFRKITIKKLDYYVVLDEDTKKDMESHCKVKNIEVIPNPLTIEVCGKSDYKRKVALSVGRLSKQKGFDLLIESWEKINKNNPEWQLIIVGEGEEYNSLMELIKRKQLQNNVSIVPFTKNIGKYYENSSIFILSSRYEGFGLVLLEAQAFGLPVISFDCPTGPRNIINHGKDGYLVESENINALSNQINELINNSTKLENIGKQAIINSHRFSIDSIITMWELVINKK